MSKVTLDPVSNINFGTSATTQINNNFSTLQTALDNTLSRDGTSPNQMTSPLDMNSNQILNLPSPSTVNSPARLIDVVSNPSITVPPVGTSGAVVPLLNGNNTWSGTNLYNAATTFAGNVTHSGTDTFNNTTSFAALPTFSAGANFNAGTVNFTGATVLGLTSSVPMLGWASPTVTSVTYNVTSADLGKVLQADATATPISFILPTPASFGIGVVGFKKKDQTSNIVVIQAGVGNLENNMPNLSLPLEGDACIMQSDGSLWKLISPGLGTLRHNFIVAEHDITQLAFNIQPSYCGYLMLVNTQVAGGPVAMNLPFINQAAFNHQCFTIGVMKVDGTANPVSIITQSGDGIADSRAVPIGGGSQKVDLTVQYKCLWFWTDGGAWFIPMSNGL